MNRATTTDCATRLRVHVSSVITCAIEPARVPGTVRIDSKGVDALWANAGRRRALAFKLVANATLIFAGHVEQVQSP
ncbi:hypothetical protein Poli38472_005269 [Pythium oligandrum]|uniref:Uncharacterized protein n=1 Tax=Pythium oligandrum TaxID=41045 RepID=A0A8K1CH13_PYTOL|nr:hypothetical protein Poli38472_005269 [Pythium oligandrum]|eukprot:TMW62651.1 hypothetical protein Poli38472_005269 [Pythium oligandrum]